MLVVEDDPVNQLLAVRLLQKRGVIPQSSQTGKEALDFCEKFSFQLILLDLHLPDISGIEVASHLRNHKGPNQHTPLVAITANTDQCSQEQCRQVGFDDFTIKPVDHHRITNILKKYQLL